MPTGTATAHRFDTDNRAYHRWRNLIDQHFTILAWETADAGRPTLVTMLDPESGDAFTVAILESLEERDPHALLAISVTARLLAYGPFAGEPATAHAAPALAHANPDIHATCPVPLHDPAQPTVPDSAWRGIPPHLADLQPAPADAPAAALVLLDRATARVAVIGPFTVATAATLWQPTDPPTGAERLVIAIQPALSGNPAPAATDS
jgi:hypothetical protein